jgi:energy-coupling factor transporter ATP-binding protein EcfA2
MKEELKSWLDLQKPWIQEAAFRILTNGELDDDDIKDLANEIRNPNSVATPKESYPSLGATGYSGQCLRLKSIGNIFGIDALSPRIPLKFSELQLTVVYGENGSGKSGYTRILKKVCGKPSAADLKPNVYESTPSRRSCEIVFNHGGSDVIQIWNADAPPLDALKEVDIFDTQCGRIYLETDTEATYTPPELAFFADLVSTCQRIDSVFDKESAKLTKILPSAPDNLKLTRSIRSLSNIQAKTTEVELNEFASFTKEDEEHLEKLRELAKNNNFAKQIETRQKQQTQLESILAQLKTAVDAASEQSLNRLRNLRKTAAQTRKIATESAEALKNTTKLDGISSETWRTLWEAARSYSEVKAYPGVTFPATKDSFCVLCQQEISEEAADRMRRFDAFIKSTLEADAKVAEKSLADTIENLPKPFSPDLFKTASEASNLEDQHQEALVEVWRTVGDYLKSFVSESCPDQFAVLSPSCGVLLRDLTSLLLDRNEKIVKLKKDAEKFDLAAVVNEGKELAGRQWCTEQRQAILDEIKRCESIAQFAQWRSQTATKGITMKANKVASSLLTDAYVERFNNELETLGAGHIKVEIKQRPAAKAVVRHALFLKGVETRGKAASDILSEGENRIVALAAFLADVSGSESKAPFIFDDPISSLDQRFEEKTIDRLLALSAERQVVVFTHRLSFLGILEDKSGKNSIEAIHIRREPWGTGEPGSVPLYGKKPESALKQLKDHRVAQARKLREAGGEEIYFPLAKAICSDFRILMERIIESYFLGDLIQRHRRVVNTQGKTRRLTKITDADCEVIDKFMGKYSSFEHSQSLEAPVAVPEPEELVSDIDEVLGWLDEFIKRDPKSV